MMVGHKDMLPLTTLDGSILASHIKLAGVPKYDERFFGFGWNKVSHIMEVDAQGYADFNCDPFQ